MEKDIASRIRDLRNARDLSLRQLAELSGINHNVIHKWETGKATPNRANVVRLSELFNVKPAWLHLACLGQVGCCGANPT